MPRPGIGAVLLDEWLVEEVRKGREGRTYEGEIRGGHLVVGRLACRREEGGDLSMWETRG